MPDIARGMQIDDAAALASLTEPTEFVGRPLMVGETTTDGQRKITRVWGGRTLVSLPALADYTGFPLVILQPHDEIGDVTRDQVYAGVWANFDGTLSTSPVNQIGWLEGWKHPHIPDESRERYPHMGAVQHVGWLRLACRYARQVHNLPENALQHIFEDSLGHKPGDTHNESGRIRMATTYLFGRVMTGFVFNELLKWLAMSVADAFSVQTKIEEMMASVCTGCDLVDWPFLFAEGHPDVWVEVLTPTYSITNRAYEIQIPKVDPETMLPVTGTGAFVRVWRWEKDEYFQQQIRYFRDALLRYSKKYAHDDGQWVISDE